MSESDTDACSQEYTDVSASLLASLRCPTTGLELAPMNTESLIALNGRVTMRQAVTIEGELVERPLVSALVTQDNTRAYPVDNGIPVLIHSAAISLTSDS
jgi:uncharacterized protein YbaR (Trm112 family)